MSRRRARGPLASLRRFTRHGVAGVCVAAGLLLAAAFGAVAVQGNAAARESSGVLAEIARLETEIARKRASVAERQTDQYVLDRSRDLGYVRPNEALVVVDRDGRRVAAAPADPAPGRLARWWALFAR